MTDETWSVADAKARLSEVIERARTSGPQTIAKNGKRTAVVVSVEEWDRKAKREGNLADFFAASPLRGAKLDLQRPPDRRRDLDL